MNTNNNFYNNVNNISVIEPTRNRRGALLNELPKRIRVAAYARVSTNDVDQENSFKNQINHYTTYIQARPDWQFVKIYSDEGLSGTSIKKRPGFLQMMEDSRNGKIDLIICKSTSRFARNTVDAVSSIRELMNNGTDVLFEDIHLSTKVPNFEIIFTFFASFDQYNSESQSASIRLVQEIMRQSGKVIVPYTCFLGYRKGINGKLEIDPEQAKVVRLIYKLYLAGHTYAGIARVLEEKRILSPRGRDKWSGSTVKSILTNEKYKGDALLAKTYTNNVLDKTIHKNHGERPQYYVTDSHPAIIDRETHDLVQEKVRQSENGGMSNLAFTGKLYCADCGDTFRHKVWRSRSNKTKYSMWVCNTKSHGYGHYEMPRCSTPNLRQEKIEAAYLAAIGQLLPLESEIRRKNAKLLAFGHDPKREEKYNKQLAQLEDRCRESSERIKAFASNSLLYTDGEADYGELLTKLNQEDNEVIQAYEEFKADHREKLVAYAKVEKFLDVIPKQAKAPTTFDCDWFRSSVEKVIVKEEYLSFFFVDGSMVNVDLSTLSPLPIA